MIGELIATGITYGVGRIALNNAFSGVAEFNNIILDSGANFSGGTGGGVIFSGGTDLYDIFSNSITANNGLTKIGDNITLGGSLTGDTYIDNSGFSLRSNSFSATSLSSETVVISNSNANTDTLKINGSNQTITHNNSSTVSTFKFYTTDSSLLFGYGVNLSGGVGSLFGIRGTSETSFPGYGKKGDSFWYGGAESNGSNIVQQPGALTEDYIRFYAGQDANGTVPDIHIQGSGATRGYVGFGTDLPTEMVDINGNIRVNGQAYVDSYLDLNPQTTLPSSLKGRMFFSGAPLNRMMYNSGGTPSDWIII